MRAIALSASARAAGINRLASWLPAAGLPMATSLATAPKALRLSPMRPRSPYARRERIGLRSSYRHDAFGMPIIFRLLHGRCRDD